MEKFAQDLWEALREEVREQLAEATSDQEFNTWLPPWKGLPAQTRADKIKVARDDVLRVLDRAGYQVRKKP